MNDDLLDAGTLAYVLFSACVAVSFLLCILAATDTDDPAQFYTGSGSLSPAQNGLAIAGDYISAATVVSTTGAIALTGTEGLLTVCATVLSLLLLKLRLAGPLADGPRHYTLGDILARRLSERPARTAVAFVTLVVTFPLLLVQLAAAGTMMTVLLDLPGQGATTFSTVVTGLLMIAYVAFGGMRGTGLVQIAKMVLLLAATTLLAALVLDRYGWNPARLVAAAARGSGAGELYWRTGLQFGDSVTGRLDLVSLELTLLLGAACMPHVMMRLYTRGGARAARKAMSWAVGTVALFCGTVVVIGLGAAAVVGGRALAAEDRTGGTALLTLTRALDTGASAADESMLFAFVACAVFVTVLAAVAGITLAAATTVAHDLIARGVLRGRLTAGREVRYARWAVLAVGLVAVALAVPGHGWNPQVLIVFTFNAAASALLPALVYAFGWSGFTTTGMRWTLYGSPALVLFLTAFSPAVSGLPVSLLPDRDFAWFPLQVSGIVTIPAGFLIGWLASVLSAPEAPRRPEGTGGPGGSHGPGLPREDPGGSGGSVGPGSPGGSYGAYGSYGSGGSGVLRPSPEPPGPAGGAAPGGRALGGGTDRAPAWRRPEPDRPAPFRAGRTHNRHGRPLGGRPDLAD
ncbi:sodium/solute symporter [Streptomyces lycii]|uniref:Cation acetate symporter n=1 Tax=Streptomyces lycii TaxID=2654337 RepID=A0ABQ7FEF8_9ACTN|nr:cation acetate symporter [Streptomyces lycii]KAF4407247.1 cation acetate symporter [Streptomyces lycii]